MRCERKINNKNDKRKKNVINKTDGNKTLINTELTNLYIYRTNIS